jgi:hypothetical protein
LYKADPEVCPQELLDIVEPSITDYMNLELYKEFSDEEIGNTLFHIGPLKAPGPNGFPARFFQKNWGAMSQDIIRGGGGSKLFCYREDADMG